MVVTPSIITLFPYTTLFRSLKNFPTGTNVGWSRSGWFRKALTSPDYVLGSMRPQRRPRCSLPRPWVVLRSEEHTSELQSRGHLVCRLLLEKKNMHLVKVCWS